MQSDEDIENTIDNIHIFQSIARSIVCHDIHLTASHRLGLQSNQCHNDVIYDDKQQYIFLPFENMESRNEAGVN